MSLLPLLRSLALALVLALGPTAGASAAERPAVSIRPGEVTIGAEGRPALRLPTPPDLEIVDASAVVEGVLLAGRRATAGSSRLTLLLVDARGGSRELPAPAAAPGAAQEQPLALVDRGQLRGLLWLEGNQPGRLAVRAARWNGAGWSDLATVSPPGAGSQLALAAAPVGDGWLALWSAFDGEDDEILWARARRGRWSAPQRLAPANEVPDIAPAVAAVPGGALAAWSRFTRDGYELLLARYDGRAWSEPTPLANSGALYPTFERSGATPWLLFLQAEPRAWVALELSSVGATLGRAEIPRTTASERPRLASGGSDRVRFVAAERSLDSAWARPGP